MKSSIFIGSLFLLIHFSSFADCTSNRLDVFPTKGEIKTTAIFLLEGYAQSQAVIKGLNTQFPVYLRAGSERIPLKVVEIHVGQFHLTQALLKPEKQLIPGKEYLLEIDNLPNSEQFGAYNQETNKYDPVSYLVTDEIDTEIPQWIERPNEQEKRLINHACGPSIHIRFKLKALDTSEFLLKTTVKSIETGLETTYILLADEQVYIGHSMCAGAFDFNDGTNYQAKFQIMDASGNLSEETEWVAFTKPLD